MRFTIYDYQNRFLTPGMAESNALYVGTSAVEKQYGYARQAPGQIVEGGQVGVPYVAEFRIAAPTGGGDITLEVLGARPVMDGDSGWPLFDAEGQPVTEGLSWSPVGTLTIPASEAQDAASHRIAFSDSRNKWFKARISGATGSAFLLRG